MLCMYVLCMHACMCVCVYACMRLCVCVCVCVYVCMCGCMHVCMYACMHACMYVCMYVCISVYTGVIWNDLNLDRLEQKGSLHQQSFFGSQPSMAPFLEFVFHAPNGYLAATPKGKVRGYCARLGSRRSHSLGPADLNVAAARTEEKEYIELVLVFTIFISLHFGVSIGSQADQGSDGCKTPVFSSSDLPLPPNPAAWISTQRHK